LSPPPSLVFSSQQDLRCSRLIATFAKSTRASPIFSSSGYTVFPHQFFDQDPALITLTNHLIRR